jgi:chitodextrinase
MAGLAIGAAPDGGGSNMKKPAGMRRVIMCAAAIATTMAGCTMKSQETPPLTGPSELGVSISLRTQPEILVQDGSSQALVTITARDSNGKPQNQLSLISEIFVGGVHTDFGSLSARNLVTDGNGEARLMYTAPALPSGPAVDKGTTVEIGVTPLDRQGTGGFGNSLTRFASIRLIPPGIVVPPDGLQAAFTFTPSTPADHQNVVFDASTSTAPGNNPIATYSWNFGDGATGSGRTTTHAFNLPGTFAVTLTIGDAFNRTATTTQSIDVAGGTGPTVALTFSPVAPVVKQNVNFNAAGSVPGPGRTIRTYVWDFGDGEQKTTSTATTSHDYQTAGSYVVTLVVTDDAGHVGTGSVTVPITAPTQSGQVNVPNVVGNTQAVATSAITSAGLTVGTITPASSSSVPAGTVMLQTPAAGTIVASGSAVNLVVSIGP